MNEGAQGERKWRSVVLQFPGFKTTDQGEQKWIQTFHQLKWNHIRSDNIIEWKIVIRKSWKKSDTNQLTRKTTHKVNKSPESL